MILDTNIAYILPEDRMFALYQKPYGFSVRKVSYWARRDQELEGLYIEPGSKPKYCQDEEGFLRYFNREELHEVIK